MRPLVLRGVVFSLVTFLWSTYGAGGPFTLVYSGTPVADRPVPEISACLAAAERLFNHPAGKVETEVFGV